MLTILLYPFPKVYLPLQMPSTFFGLLMHVGAPDKKNKTEAMNFPARDEGYVAGDTSDLVLVCGGTASFTQSFVYLGSLLHRDLSDHHDVDARIKKPPRPLVRYVIISSVLAMSRTASEVVRPRGRRRQSDHLFGMGNPGAGPRWLEARHESAFRHWKTAAAATSVRHQSHTRGEAELPGAACPGD